MRKRKGFKPGEHVQSQFWNEEFIIEKWYSKGVYLARRTYTNTTIYLRASEMTRLNKFTEYDRFEKLKFNLACIGSFLLIVSMALAVIFESPRL